MAPAALVLVLLSHAAQAEIYAYVNEDGDYVVTRDVPGKKVAEYAVLTDEGEFLRLIRPQDTDIPLTHWRPWFLPAEQHASESEEQPYTEREGVVGIEEMEEPRENPAPDSGER